MELIKLLVTELFPWFIRVTTPVYFIETISVSAQLSKLVCVSG